MFDQQAFKADRDCSFKQKLLLNLISNFHSGRVQNITGRSYQAVLINWELPHKHLQIGHSADFVSPLPKS
jgi:hypothetical protein